MELSSAVACWCCVFLCALAIAFSFSQPAPIARPGCPTRCGNLAIPYPFGIGSGCAFDSNFEILCDTRSNPPKPFLTTEEDEPTLVYDISDRQIWIPNPVSLTACYDSKGAFRPMQFPYNFTFLTFWRQRYNHYSSSLENKFTTVGCDDTLLISQGTNDVSSCTSRCSNASQVPPVNGTTCSGVGCCQLPIPKDLNKMYNISMVSAMNHTKVWSFNPCAHTFLGDMSRFRFLGASDLSNPNFPRRVYETVPLVVDWAIGDLNCKEAQHNTEYACTGNSHCVDSDTGFGGYRCTCDHGYQGNPYLGCIDPPIGKLTCDEARNGSVYACHANSHCLDSDTGLGGYRCRCDNGYEGNPYHSPGCTASTIAQTTTNLSQATAPIARPGCSTRCGNLGIPYPFGIGSGCAFDSNFEILCDTSSNPPKPVIAIGGDEPTLVYDISDRQIWIPNPLSLTVCYDSKGAFRPTQSPFNNFTILTVWRQRYTHYSFSLENKFTTVGCDDTMLISHGPNDVSTCTSRCSNASQVPPVNGTTCSGVDCCHLPMPKDLNKFYNVSMVSAMNHTKVWSFNPCAYTFYGDTSRFRFLGASDLSNPNFIRRVYETVPAILDWVIGDLNCKEAQHITEYACKGNSHCVDSDTGLGGYRCTCDHGYQGNPYLGCIDPPIGKLSCDEAKKGSVYACHANSHCLDSDTGLGGYRCRCDNGYEGNPYLSPGCTDIDECKNPETMKSCEQRCINFPGGFNCSCLEGYFGDGRKGGQGCILTNKKSAASSWFKLSLGIGLGTVVFVALATSLSYIIKKINDAKMRLKFFEQNGGFLLEQKITDGGSDRTEVTKIFSAKELRQATNNFAQDMILGQY